MVIPFAWWLPIVLIFVTLIALNEIFIYYRSKKRE